MSAGRYPLVAFDHPFTDHIADVVDRTCKNSGKEAAWGVTDKRCMVGTKTLAQAEAKHSMEGSKGVGLLDGAPLPLPILPAESSSHNPGHHRQPHRTIGNDEVDNTTIITPNTWPWAALHTSSALLPYIPYIGGGNGHSAFATAVLWATGLGLIGAMWMYKRFKGVRVRFNFEFPEADVAKEVTLQLDVANPLPVVPLNAAEQESPLENATIATAPIAIPTPESPPTVTDPIAAVSNTPEIISSLDADGDESGGEGGEGENGEPEKRKGRKKRRGKKKKVGAADPGEGEEKEAGKDEADKEDIKVQEEEVPTGLVFSHAPKPVQVQAQAPTSLIVSDTILGFGSHGTVVFSGSLQGRAVAVKRLLQDFVTLAAREVSILQESDDHPNVIRYYYQEAQANFLYIALELCPCSLADIIEAPQLHQEISAAFDPKRALRQITSGLRHLHGLKLIHRDIKPQNILVSSAKRNGTGKDRGHRMLISDFGLCKKLDFDQTSFLPTAHGAAGAGTVGWRAPEILRGEVKLDDALNEDTVSSRGSVTGKNTSLGGTSTGSTIGDKPTRLTKLVDIFALGCLFYYTLTNGGHPYGDRFEREVNILKNQKSLEGLERFGEEGAEAAELISSMLSIEARERLVMYFAVHGVSKAEQTSMVRPDTTTCLLHPFFWDQGRRLTFLQDASDRFEIMCRDPRDPLLVTLEKGAYDIVGNDWHTRLDKIFIDNLGKFRKYDGRSVQDLLRALRNKKHHYQDLPDNVKRHLGPMPEGFLSYFTKRYPCLFLHVHGVVSSTSLRYESMFRSYFDLAD
ncbi:hypothetical protein HWV62_25679 [Athelia sp. TMB]|nr:hypothetical protein HWV62_25679 [Athelia sp. TMB]